MCSIANIDTLMGIMDKALYDQEIKSDVITIGCIALDKKINPVYIENRSL